MKGVVFELQKFALHDGPGIRTVIFLKGCPLRCDWCSNPESFIKKPQLLYDANKCNGSMNCLTECKEGAISRTGNMVKVEYSKCNACGNCATVCFPKALKISGWESDVDEIIKEVAKDKAYFDNSGGGITLSGGEPMFQPEFATALLATAKQQKIHTCLETSGYTYKVRFEAILPNTDIVLFDFKHFDDQMHRKHTGRSNKMILENLDYICSQNIKVVLRCPIIPGINEDIRHFIAIAELSNKYKSIEQIEIMPYHNYGAHKFEQLGMEPYKITHKSVEKAEAEKWKETLRKLGCHKLI